MKNVIETIINDTINYITVLESVAHINMKRLNWAQGFYVKRDDTIDPMSLEEVLNSYTYELLKFRNVGRKKVNAIKDCVAKLFPKSFLARVPLFNEYADKIPTQQQKERDALKRKEEEEQEQRVCDLAQLIRNNVAVYGLDEDDDEE